MYVWAQVDSPLHKYQQLLEAHLLHFAGQILADLLCFSGHGVNALRGAENTQHYYKVLHIRES